MDVAAAAPPTLPAQTGARPRASPTQQQHYHSLTALPVEPWEADVDSEDEAQPRAAHVQQSLAVINALVAPAPERRLMGLWTLYVAEHPILADSLVADACAGFCARHAAELSSDSDLHAAFVEHCVRLWLLGTLSRATMDECTRIIDGGARAAVEKPDLAGVEDLGTVTQADV